MIAQTTPDINLDDLVTVDAARRLLPIWTDWGVDDVQVTVHSLGVTFWTLLGSHNHAVAVAEMPAPTLGAYPSIGRDVRSDSIWFDRATRRPLLIVEFERYDGISDEQKLIGKVESLLLAHHRSGSEADHLVLAYWTAGLRNTPDHDKLRSVVAHGFRAATGATIRGADAARLCFYQFIMRADSAGGLRLDTIIKRGTS